MDDRALLKQFVDQRSEEAFAELVRQHIDLVYAAARRQLRDPATVEDVTQSVFVLLSKKAHTIRDSEALAGWLLVSTRCVALNAIRTESRRRNHESRAAEMKEQLQADAEQQWEAIRPMLDEAVEKLKSEDRDAITLRYFKGQSMNEVAAALGVSPEAAQKRVLRAVDRLRDFFARHGVMTSSDALVTTLAGNVLAQAPAEFTAQVVATALGAGYGGASLGISKTGASFVAAAKAKVAVAVTAAVVIVGAGTSLVQHLGRSSVAAQLEQAAVPPAEPLPPATRPADDWMKRINEVYGLADGQLLKRVMPPFIPERGNFFSEFTSAGTRRTANTRAQIVAGAAVFRFDGKGVRWTSAMRDPMDLGEVFKAILGIWPQDTEIDRALIATRVPGDWVLRDGAKPEELRSPLTASIAEVIGPATVLRNEPMEREVVVVRGTLKYTDLKNAENFPTVYLFRGARRPTRGYNLSVGQTPSEMLQIVGEVIGRPMVVEADLTGGKAAAVGMNELVDLRRAAEAPDAALTDELLAKLSNQTSLEFKRERRKVPTWRLIRQEL